MYNRLYRKKRRFRKSIRKIQSLLDSYEYDDYDRLIQLLDSTCNADGTKNLEKLMGKDLYTVLQ